MSYLKMLVWLLTTLIGTLSFNGCATIIGGGSVPPSERTANIRWGYVLADMLVGGGVVGLIIDFATGAIYERVELQKGQVDKDLRDHLAKGIPSFVVKKEGIYRVELIGAQLSQTRVPDGQFPLKVLNTLQTAVGYHSSVMLGAK